MVDDDPALADAIVEQLQARGYRAVSVGRVDDALRRLGEGDYDAVLSDVWMPGKGGLALQAELRALRPELPVVLMSGGPLPPGCERNEAFARGRFLRKPFGGEALVESLSRALVETSKPRH